MSRSRAPALLVIRCHGSGPQQRLDVRVQTASMFNDTEYAKPASIADIPPFGLVVYRPERNYQHI